MFGGEFAQNWLQAITVRIASLDQRERPDCVEGEYEVGWFGMDSGRAKPHFSLPSIIAIGAAVGSFFVGAFGGFVLALVAIVCGIIGLLLSLAPSVRGGFISMLSLIVAGIGIVVAAIKAIAWVM